MLLLTAFTPTRYVFGYWNWKITKLQLSDCIAVAIAVEMSSNLSKSFKTETNDTLNLASIADDSVEELDQ